MATVALVPQTQVMVLAPSAPNLYDIEEGLQALLDTADLVSAEDQDAFLAELGNAITAAADKRDRTAHFLSWIEAQQEYIGKEIARLQALKKHYGAVEEKVEGFVVYTIRRLGVDAKGKYKRLEGNTTVLSVRKSPASVEITNEAMIPLDLKRATVTLPAALWNETLNALDDDMRAVVLDASKDTLKVEIEKRAVKAALDAGVEIAGAKLQADNYGLVRR